MNGIAKKKRKLSHCEAIVKGGISKDPLVIYCSGLKYYLSDLEQTDLSSGSHCGFRYCSW
jgi:hypothetical protein